MKKILLALVVLLSSQFIYAGGPIQWRAGVMALPHNGWIVSPSIKITDGTVAELHTPQFTFNTNLGFVAGVNFTDLIGVEVDVILGKFKQEYKLEITDAILGELYTGNYTVEISKTDIPVLLKVGGLMYFEVGPQFTMINKVESVSDNGTDDVSDLYNTSQLYGILGTGVGFDIPKIARVEAGLRLGYGFNDLNAGKGLYDNEKIYQAFWGIKLALVHKF